MYVIQLLTSPSVITALFIYVMNACARWDSWVKIPVALSMCFTDTLQWRHNDHGGLSNHQSRGCLLNCLFRRRWKKTSKLRVTGLCAGNSAGPVNSPHKGPVTRKMFPFDDVIMNPRQFRPLTQWQTSIHVVRASGQEILFKNRC